MTESYTKHTRVKKDQAESLRMTEFSRQISKSKALTRVISFTSGKGGVGKTNTVVNLALCLANLGKSVLILDADLGLANVDVLLGLQSKYRLNDVLEGKCSLADVIITGPGGISIIPAASGVESICNLDADQRLCLTHAIEEVASSFDYLLIDTQAGISSDVMHFNAAAGEIVCVITAEPTSLTDAYAMIKILAQSYSEKTISILANNIHPTHRTAEQEGDFAFRKLQNSVAKFLQREQVDLRYLGCIPAEHAVKEAVCSQRALVELFPSSGAGLAFARLAKKVDANFPEYRVKGGMQFFFQQLMEVNAYGS